MIALFKSDETDFTHNGIGSLDSHIINPEVEEELNGLYSFSFKYPLFAPHGLEITGESIVRVPVPVVADDQLFRVYRPVKSMGYITVSCYHIFYDLADNFIEDTNIVEKDGQGALQQLGGATQFGHRFRFFSDISTIANARLVRRNPVNALLDDQQANSFVSRWGGELIRNNFDVRMNRSAGSNKGFEVKHRKNLLGYDADVDVSTVFTRIMPKGFDGLLLPEKYIDSPLIGHYESPKIKMIDYEVKAAIGEYAEDEDAIPLEDAYKELRRLAAEEYSVHKIDVPAVQYKVNFVTLEQTEEYKDLEDLQQLKLGDMATVDHAEDDFKVTAKLVRYKWNPISKRYLLAELGSIAEGLTTSFTNIKKISRDVNELKEQSLIIQSTADGKNTIYRGEAEPTKPNIGDLWYKPNGDETQMYQYVDENGQKFWKLIVDTGDVTKVQKDVDEAIEQVQGAKDRADEAVAKADNATANANDAIAKSQEGFDAAQDALDKSIIADGKAQQAIDKAQGSFDAAQDALGKVDNLQLGGRNYAGEFNAVIDGSIIAHNPYWFDGIDNATISKQTNQRLNVLVVYADYATNHTNSTILYSNPQLPLTVKKRDDGTKIFMVVVGNLKNLTESDFTITKKQLLDAKVKVELGNKATDYMPPPEDVDQKIKVVADNLNGLSVTVSNNKNDVADLTIKADGLQTQVANNKGDISTVTQLAKGLQTRVGNAEGSISTLQQTATQLNSTITTIKSDLYDKKNALPYMELGGLIWINGDETGSTDRIRSGFFEVDPNTAYVMSLNGSTYSVVWFEYDADKKYIATRRPGVVSHTTGSTTKYMRIVRENVTNPNQKFQIEKGSAATGYAPHIPSNAEVNRELSVINQTIDGIATRVQSNADNYSTLTQTVSGIQTEVNKKVDKITYNSKMTQLDNLIQTKVSQTDADSKYTQQSVFNQFKNGFTTRVEEIENWEIGGRNLMLNTDYSDIENVNRLVSIVSTTVDGNSPPDYPLKFVRLRRDVELGNQIYFQTKNDRFAIVKGNTYTLSFIYIVPSGMNSDMTYTYLMSDTQTNQKLNITKKKVIGTAFTSFTVHHATFTFKANWSDDAAWMLIGTNAVASGIYWVRVSSPQLETGNKATPWRVAPEDTNQKFSLMTQTVDTISSQVTKKVDKTTYDSYVQQTAQSLASKISTVDANNKFATQSSLTQTAQGLQTQVTSKADQSTVTQLSNLLNSTITNKADKSEVTQLADLVSTKVTSSQVNNLIATDKQIKDTRETNEKPSWYFAEYPRQTVREFKRNNLLGITTDGSYGVLESEVPWSNTSGGQVKQTLYTDIATYERRGINSSDTWQPWKKIADVDYVASQVSVLNNAINLRVTKNDLMSQINLDTSGILISGKKLILDGDTTVTGLFRVKDANIVNVNADKMTTGTLNAALVNVINLNASNMVTGTLDATKAKVINLNASNITTGSLNANNVKVTATNGKSHLDLSSTGLQTFDTNGIMRIALNIRSAGGAGADPATLRFFGGDGKTSAGVGMNVNDTFVIGSTSNKVHTELYSGGNTLLYANQFRVVNKEGTGGYSKRSFIFNSLESETGDYNPCLYPDISGWGYIGTHYNRMYRIYTNYLHYTDLVNLSTRDSKSNIQTANLKQMQDAFDEMGLVTYNYKNEDGTTRDDELKVGWIAEDSPSIITSKDKKQVSLNNTIGVIAGSAKYQQKRIDILEETVENLQMKIAKLEAV